MKKEYKDVLEDYFNETEQEYLEENVKDVTRNLTSFFAILYEHLLKFKFQSYEAGTDWVDSISDSNNAILRIINSSTNNRNLLYNNKDTILSSAYKSGRNKAIKLTRLPQNTFPKYYYENTDFDLNLILSRAYLKKYIIDHKPEEVNRQKAILKKVQDKFNDV